MGKHRAEKQVKIKQSKNVQHLRAMTTLNSKTSAKSPTPGKGFILAATHSGSGKTTITLGLLAALKKRAIDVQPFKCGPDFIDPTLHTFITEKNSRNLDLHMCGSAFVQNCYRRHGANAQISLIEGVMGLFDGGEGSAAALSKKLQLPVILVVDAKAAAESVAAVVKGFESLDPKVKIAGVIFNRVGSPRHKQLIRDAVYNHCNAQILGFVPWTQDITIPDRHLGLAMGQERPLSSEQIDLLAHTMEENIDLDLLISCVYSQPATSAQPEEPRTPAREETASRNLPVRIGVAYDNAFCFYYQDNFDLFEKHGVEFIRFSPLKDQSLPENIDGIYLGGGYPELYAKQLSGNTTMREAMLQWSKTGRPIYAECGGFMYLTEGITDLSGLFWPMVSVFPTNAIMEKRLVQLGYREINITAQCCFGSTGTIFGHEFHYSKVNDMPKEVDTYICDGDMAAGYKVNNTFAGYVHIHFGKTPKAVQNFVEFCRNQA